MRPSWWSVAAELFGLTALAVAQPVLDGFGRAPEVLVAADAGPADVWTFALVVTLAPPLALLLVEAVAAIALGSRAQRILHAVFVGALVVLVAIRGVRLIVGWVATPLLMAAIATAVGVVVLRQRFEVVRSWLTFTAIAPALFVANFVALSPASSLALGTDTTTEAIDAATVSNERGSIVLVVLDELPTRSLLAADGTVDAERFPGFGALAADSTWFRNSTSVAGYTHNAVPAIFTGRYPGAEEVAATARNHPDNLFRLLGGSYRLNVVEPQTNLCTLRRCDAGAAENAVTEATANLEAIATPTRSAPWRSLIGEAVDRYGEMVALHDREPVPAVEPETFTTTTAAEGDPDELARTEPAAVQPDRFASWIRRIDGSTDSPQFSVLHVTLPHNPWYLDSAGRRYAYPEGSDLAGGSAGRWSNDAGAAMTARQRHLLQLRYVDTLIGALRARLIELDAWSNTTVVVTADHGAGFEPGEAFRIWDADAQSDLVGVPLFVHGPDFRPGFIDDTATQAVDIAPTIAGVAGIRAPWSFDGFDLRALPATPRTEHPYGSTPDYGRYERIDIDVRDNLRELLERAESDGDDGGDDLDILRSGPSGDRIGTRLDEVDVAPPIDGRATLRSPAKLDFAPRDGAVAALVIGRVESPGAAAGMTIVLSVDGTVAATASTFRTDGGSIEFSALLPPEWMTRSAHEVRAFVELDDGRLAPLALGA